MLRPTVVETMIVRAVQRRGTKREADLGIVLVRSGISVAMNWDSWESRVEIKKRTIFTIYSIAVVSYTSKSF